MNLSADVTHILFSSCTVVETPKNTSDLGRTSSVYNLTPTKQESLYEPSAPFSFGQGLDLLPDEELSEIDCAEAENRCESREFLCDDLTDRCDIGPDGLGELPDEYDWDGG